MTNETHAKTLARMNRLIGHAQSNKKMLLENKYCIDIITQNLAVIAALHKVNEKLLENHLHTCVRKAMQSNDPKKQAGAIEEVLAVYQKSIR